MKQIPLENFRKSVQVEASHLFSIHFFRLLLGGSQQKRKQVKDKAGVEVSHRHVFVTGLQSPATAKGRILRCFGYSQRGNNSPSLTTRQYSACRGGRKAQTANNECWHCGPFHLLGGVGWASVTPKPNKVGSQLWGCIGSTHTLTCSGQHTEHL